MMKFSPNKTNFLIPRLCKEVAKIPQFILYLSLVYALKETEGHPALLNERHYSIEVIFTYMILIPLIFS